MNVRLSDGPTSPETAEAAELRRLHRALTSLVARQLGGSEVDDIVGEAFLRLLERSPEARALECPHAYLLSIAKNLVYGEIRRRVRERKVLEPANPDEDESLGTENPAARAAMFELESLLGRLSELDRRAFVLRKIEGFELEQIAAVLGISRSTTQRRVASASQFLRRSASRSALLSDFL